MESMPLRRVLMPVYPSGRSMDLDCYLLWPILAGLVYPLLPNIPVVKHAFSIVISTICVVGMYKVDSLYHIAGMPLVVYILTYFGRKYSVTPILVFVGAIAHLIYVESKGGWPDNSPILMTMILKVVSFAWTTHDGTKKAGELRDDSQRTLAVRVFPGPIEYFGFMFFFAGFWVGPVPEFSEYRDFVNKRGVFSSIPSSFFTAFKGFVLGYILLYVLQTYSSIIPIEFCSSREFASWPFWKQYYDETIGSWIVYRTVFTSGWKLGEVPAIYIGIGYAGRDAYGNDSWDRVSNINVFKVEFAENVKMLITNWNVTVEKWLKKYVYYRLTPAHQKPGWGAAFLTALSSSMWHGVEPGYLLAFTAGSMLTVTGQSIRRYIRPLFTTPGSTFVNYKRVYDIVGWAITLVFIDYAFYPFPVKTLKAGLALWKVTNYSVHVISLSTIFILEFGGLGSFLKRYVASITPPSPLIQVKARKMSSPKKRVVIKETTSTPELVNHSASPKRSRKASKSSRSKMD